MLMALGTFVRPNVALASGVIVLCAIVFALRQRALARGGAIFAGFATLAVSPLHNWVFGHSLVPFAEIGAEISPDTSGRERQPYQ